MGIAEIVHDTITDWPQLSSESRWVLLSLPFFTLVGCVIWLRVLWPCPEAVPKDFEPVSSMKDNTEATSLAAGASNG